MDITFQTDEMPINIKKQTNKRDVLLIKQDEGLASY